jgi:hypothetical protein
LMGEEPNHRCNGLPHRDHKADPPNTEKDLFPM